ncbi:hypothetical protein V6N13_098367 [Hibiscus sabdariffa]|uniref:Uncharacterized protein n=1 Tax=Hibiscus sabdariffa TaxID=183260 RepID=A0ABR2EDL0_9ROSI
MDLLHSYLALVFQLLLLLCECGSEIYAVKDLRGKLGNGFPGTGDAVKGSPELSYQLVKELEGKYSSIANWRSAVDKNPELPSQLAKELEDKYSSVANWRSAVDKNPELSSQLAKDLENKYLSLSGLKSSSRFVKGVDDKYSIVNL